jgi:hypothetical protein
MPNGIFTERFARRRTWKLNEQLMDAMDSVIPAGLSVADIGAGAGMYVAEFRRRGRPAIGYDGIPNVGDISEGRVREVDLARYQALESYLTAHWSICIEVGEHIPSSLQEIFLDNLCSSAKLGLIISWALPGQRGKAHINCRMPEWVACEVGRRDWELDEERTRQLREVMTRGWARKLMVFTKA